MDCIFDAPIPSAASRIDGGTDLRAARVAMIMVGNVISVRTNPPTIGADCRQANEVDEKRQTENAEHDRGNRSQVGDIDFNEVSPAVFAAQTPPNRLTLRPRWAGTMPTRSASCRPSQEWRHRGPQLPGRGVGSVRRCEEIPVETQLQKSGLLQLVGQHELLGRNVAVQCGTFHVHPALEVAVYTPPRRGR